MVAVLKVKCLELGLGKAVILNPIRESAAAALFMLLSSWPEALSFRNFMPVCVEAVASGNANLSCSVKGDSDVPAAIKAGCNLFRISATLMAAAGVAKVLL